MFDHIPKRMFFYSARADLLLAPSPFALGQTSQLFYIVSLLGGPSASSQPAPFAHDFDETLPMDIDVVETIDLAPAEEPPWTSLRTFLPSRPWAASLQIPSPMASQGSHPPRRVVTNSPLDQQPKKIMTPWQQQMQQPALLHDSTWPFFVG